MANCLIAMDVENNAEKHKNEMVKSADAVSEHQKLAESLGSPLKNATVRPGMVRYGMMPLIGPMAPTSRKSARQRPLLVLLAEPRRPDVHESQRSDVFLCVQSSLRSLTRFQ
jgi:hypothetical protein